VLRCSKNTTKADDIWGKSLPPVWVRPTSAPCGGPTRITALARRFSKGWRRGADGTIRHRFPTTSTSPPAMSQPARTATSAALSSTAVSGVAGLMLGQIVLALALHHGRSVEGLGYALVFLLAGGASVACFLSHRHQQRRPRNEPAPLRLWVGALALGVFASMAAVGSF
jgi:hypothetical protein